jgi:hypothetical protein
MDLSFKKYGANQSIKGLEQKTGKPGNTENPVRNVKSGKLYDKK